jgi:hypothetical protein
MRQQQQPFGAQALGFLRVFDGLTGRAANTGKIGTLVAQVSTAVLITCEYSLAAREKNSPVPPAANKADAPYGASHSRALDVALTVKITLSIEIGERKRQQARREDGLQFLWIHYSNTLGDLDDGSTFVVRHRTTNNIIVNPCS